MLGRKFGNLTVESLAGSGKRGVSWWCRCFCGKVVKLGTFKLEKDGYESCGCSKTFREFLVPTPVDLKRKFRLTYVSWHCMIDRCYGKNKQKCYEGIEVCERWYAFANFLKDMKERPSKEYSLDREDPIKGYCKENCRWLLKSENSKNIRRNLSPERNRNVSEGLKKAYAEGKILITEQKKEAIAKGSLKRIGRKARPCTKCGSKAFMKLCQRCRGKRKKIDA